MVIVFDFLTFFLGLSLVSMGELFILTGQSESNLGLAAFAIIIILIGLGISVLREMTGEESRARDLNKIYGLICYLCGFSLVILPVFLSYVRLTNSTMTIASAMLLLFTVFVGLVFLFLGYSWAGAFSGNSTTTTQYDDNPRGSTY